MSNIFIYGSCVSRDSLKFMSEEHELVGYVARQSLISAFSAPAQAAVNIKLASAFQRRMVSGDLRSDLTYHLSKLNETIDLLVIDLTDERLGIDILTSTISATHSVELANSKWLDGLKSKPKFVALGTPKHWEMWKAAANKLFHFLDDKDLIERTVIYHTPWANTSITGAEVPLFRGINSDFVASELLKCAAYLEGLGLKVKYMPRKYAVTTPEHEWGIAPYHYIEDAYMWISRSLEDILSNTTSKSRA